MTRFKLKRLYIKKPPFRKLKDIDISFADRITLIAGHNGIGKSTILALVANGSGLTEKTYSSYTQKTFQGNLNEIIHLDFETEFALKQGSDLLPKPILEYDLSGNTFEKRCALTKRARAETRLKAKRDEVRVVPRNHPIKTFIVPGTAIEIGVASKVPLPTIYLGMTRMLPIGESDPDMVENLIDTSINQEDAKFITSFVNSVIGVSALTGSSEIITQEITGTTKSSKHPAYSHSPKSVSLGQDSLSSIATALASFQKLKREWDDYPGGLLVIDEVDAGFHPHAQRKLIQGIAGVAKKLNLQVIATTHSLSLIEAIHPDSNPMGDNGVRSDKVIYIRDTKNPSISDWSLEAIRDDMNLVAPKPSEKITTPYLKVYLEDAEANIFFKKLLTRSLNLKVKSACGYLLKPIPISLGCNNIQGLQKFDPHFKTVLIAVDADSNIKGARGQWKKNIVKLPGGRNTNGTGMNPERTIFEFAKELVDDEERYPASWDKLKELRVTTDQIHEYLLTGDTNITKRDSAKKWMNARLTYIANWKLVELWIDEHPSEVRQFEEAIIAAAVATVNFRI